MYHYLPLREPYKTHKLNLKNLEQLKDYISGLLAKPGFVAMVGGSCGSHRNNR